MRSPRSWPSTQFEGGLPDGRPPAESLTALIQQANAQIHEQAQTDSQRAGMGTTVTAAYVDGDSVVVAHVGDSRCYLWRDGDLIRLTRDHSLVDELIRRGKLTEEQAESHPQRSVITRALGPEANVEVDVEAFPARAGDVFLLCSDGLTSMVHEAKLKPLLAENGGRSLEQTGRTLIAAANEAGGRDNITVILFRLEEVDDRRGAGAASATVAAEQATVESATAEGDGYDTYAGESLPPRQGVTRPAGSYAEHAEAGPEQEEEYRRHGTVALQALRPGDARLGDGAAAPAREPPPRTAPLPDAVPPPAGKPERRRRRRRSGGLLILVLAIVLPLIVGAWLATRAVYFIGTDPANGQTVTIFRGLPYELPFGIDLYERYYDSGVTLPGVPAARRARFTDHQLRTRDDAENLVIALEKGQLE